MGRSVSHSFPGRAGSGRYGRTISTRRARTVGPGWPRSTGAAYIERERERGTAIVVATYFTVARRPQINAWLYNVEICATSFYDPATRHARWRRRNFCRLGSPRWSAEIDASADRTPVDYKYKVGVS